MRNELKEFGLTENEIEIYLTLLRLGSANPSEIAEKTGLSRSYVYDALERMLEKGIVSSVSKKNKKHFIAIDPKYLERLASQRLENIQKIIPQLQKIQESTKEEIKVELHKGKYVYKILLNDIVTTLKRGDEVLIYGIDDNTLTKRDLYTPIFLDQYLAKIIKLGIKEKLITKEATRKLPQAKTTTYKFLPKETIGDTAFEVYSNKVAIFLWGNPNYLILITSKEIAKSYKNQFKLLWKIAKP